jgi:hypothetical protein
MKSIIKAFPYPILGRGDDYLDSEFQSTMDTRKDMVGADEHIFLDYSFLLSNEDIDKLLIAKKASYAIDVHCSDTLFRKVYSVGANGSIEFESGQLYGKVTFTPLVITTQHINDFQSDDLNEEFGEEPFSLQVGDIMAIDDPQIRYIEFDKLQFESLVRVETAPEIPDETYRFRLEEDMITILMGKKFRHVWDVCREEKDKAPMLAMSVYKDCIHAALEYIIKNEDAEQHKWVRALKLKLDSLGKHIKEDSDFNELCTQSQQLVAKYGVQRLMRNVG